MHIKNVLIACFLFLLIFTIGAFLYRHYDQQSYSSMEPHSQKTSVKANSDKSKSKNNIHTDNKIADEFYQQIIDNDIFRPLGWKPPKKPEQYILIGTASTPDEVIPKLLS